MPPEHSEALIAIAALGVGTLMLLTAIIGFFLGRINLHFVQFLGEVTFQRRKIMKEATEAAKRIRNNRPEDHEPY